MTNALRTYTTTFGGDAGYCTKCGCHTISKPGHPRRYKHTTRTGAHRRPNHRYNWFHIPDSMTKNVLAALGRRIWWTTSYLWKRTALHRRFVKG